MRKILILLLNLILLVSCTQKESDIELIDNFATKYFLNKIDKIDIPEFASFTNLDVKFYNSLSEKQKLDLKEYLIFMLNNANEELKIYDYRYKIVQQQDLEHEIIKNYNIDFKNKNSIYYMISKNKIFAFFIVENGKISSFFPKGFMSINKKNIEPFLLSSENDLKEFLGI
jgi:hypothetical protein